MAVQTTIKDQVREFYNQVGWQEVSEGLYQNARYEDLRPVAREYIHRCHLRVLRHLKSSGKYLLDAGSGPIQYPEYLEYSRGYEKRVCVDISRVALVEARKRIEAHGLYVVADIANLPFKAGVFEGAVTLHTIHHLPEDEHLQAYQELYRLLRPGSAAVVVNGWGASRMMSLFNPLIRIAQRVIHLLNRWQNQPAANPPVKESLKNDQGGKPKGTFTNRHEVAWMNEVVGSHMPLEIRVWRSVSVRFMRALIHPALGGRYWLRLLYWLEERLPHYFGENGQYPLVVIRKPAQDRHARAL